jgi:hypothetical protein
MEITKTMQLLVVFIFISTCAAETRNLMHPRDEDRFGRPEFPPPPQIEPFFPCIWSESQLLQLVPKHFWMLSEHTNTLDYALCRMKARHILDHRHAPIDGNGGLQQWRNISSEYVVFRINRLLAEHYNYVTIPIPHESVEIQIADELTAKCQMGSCTDYHVSWEECGGSIDGLEYIMSDFYYIHLSMYETGMLRLRICNGIVSGGINWLDNLLSDIAIKEVNFYEQYEILNPTTLADGHTQSWPWYVSILIALISIALFLIFVIIMVYWSRRMGRQ